MSEYFYLVCDSHKESTPAASRTAGGCCNLADGEETLIPFIIAHAGCAVRILDEGYFEGCEWHEWKEENVEQEIQRAKDDKRW